MPYPKNILILIDAVRRYQQLKASNRKSQAKARSSFNAKGPVSFSRVYKDFGNRGEAMLSSQVALSEQISQQTTDLSLMLPAAIIID